MNAREKGLKFEVEFGKEFGLKGVPGSGNQWHSKLDLTHGRLARWSLKFTEAKTFTIDRELIEEAVSATEGLEGGGEVPVWALSIEGLGEELVMLRKEDFKAMQAGELKLVNLEPTKRDERSARAAVPVLLRGTEGGG